MVGLLVELDGIDGLVFLKEVLGILREKSVNFLHVVCFGQFNGHVPLVKMYTAVYCRLHFITLNVKDE